MSYKFFAYGHPNILGTHKSTLEFTKDKSLSPRGDCIIGVSADFRLDKLKELIKNSKGKKISITIKAVSKGKKIQDAILAEINQSFNDSREFVIRKTDFESERTFAKSSDKAAFDIKRSLINFLKEKEAKIMVVIENK